MGIIMGQKKEQGKQKGQVFLVFGIRNKIILCFLIPILFMGIIGMSAYRKSAEGMSDKFMDSTMQTVNMAMEYVDMSCNFIEAEALKYAFDKDLSKYFGGMYANDPVARMNVTNNVKSNIMSSRTSNDFISDIHIVTKAGTTMFSTATGSSVDGVFEDYLEQTGAEGRFVDRWVDSHDLLDEAFSLKQSDYILAHQTLSKSSNAMVVIDLKASAIRDFMETLDMGQGSILGFVTKNGREILSENLPEGQESTLPEGEPVFFGQDFFPALSTDQEAVKQDAYEVTYRGQDWMFLYSTSDETQATFCALIPKALVVGQAEEIKNLTLGLVLLAAVIVLVIGLLIVAGIQGNMKNISGKFGEVAKGDLTVQVQAKGRDEFRGLAGSANNMIENTKKLVLQVSAATGQLEDSSQAVEEASGVISRYSQEITRAIDGINDGMGRQAEHAKECVAKTDVLSDEIQSVSRVVEEVGKLVDETKDKINRGMAIVQSLGERARESTAITAKVGESIESLRRESEIINSFVSTITEISEQTNLLSLNASIEAARAGEAGRGFAVVAEEIRKLADDSAKAAGEISNNVEHITAQTLNSVESAREARDMVASQTEAVEQVTEVFQEMQQHMVSLIDGLQDIVANTERADAERGLTVEAVQNISGIIRETAASAQVVQGVVDQLMDSVENLNSTARDLGENMQGLKKEVAVFKL